MYLYTCVGACIQTYKCVVRASIKCAWLNVRRAYMCVCVSPCKCVCVKVRVCLCGSERENIHLCAHEIECLNHYDFVRDSLKGRSIVTCPTPTPSLQVELCAYCWWTIANVFPQNIYKSFLSVYFSSLPSTLPVSFQSMFNCLPIS